jgi:hypothetical protein
MSIAAETDQTSDTIETIGNYDVLLEADDYSDQLRLICDANHVGNNRFQVLLKMNSTQYEAGLTAGENTTQVVKRVADIVCRQVVPNGRFLVQRRHSSKHQQYSYWKALDRERVLEFVRDQLYNLDKIDSKPGTAIRLPVRSSASSLDDSDIAADDSEAIFRALEPLSFQFETDGEKKRRRRSSLLRRSLSESILSTNSNSTFDYDKEKTVRKNTRCDCDSSTALAASFVAQLEAKQSPLELEQQYSQQTAVHESLFSTDINHHDRALSPLLELTPAIRRSPSGSYDGSKRSNIVTTAEALDINFQQFEAEQSHLEYEFLFSAESNHNDRLLSPLLELTPAIRMTRSGSYDGFKRSIIVTTAEALDVIFQQGSSTAFSAQQHTGNNRLRVLIDVQLDTYMTAVPTQRRNIIQDLQETVQTHWAGRFLMEIQDPGYAVLSEEDTTTMLFSACEERVAMRSKPQELQTSSSPTAAAAAAAAAEPERNKSMNSAMMHQTHPSIQQDRYSTDTMIMQPSSNRSHNQAVQAQRTRKKRQRPQSKVRDLTRSASAPQRLFTAPRQTMHPYLGFASSFSSAGGTWVGPSQLSLNAMIRADSTPIGIGRLPEETTSMPGFPDGGLSRNAMIRADSTPVGIGSLPKETTSMSGFPDGLFNDLLSSMELAPFQGQGRR